MQYKHERAALPMEVYVQEEKHFTSINMENAFKYLLKYFESLAIAMKCCN